jgi:hypothetical protein
LYDVSINYNLITAIMEASSSSSYVADPELSIANEEYEPNAPHYMTPKGIH